MYATTCDLCDSPAVIHDTVARGGIIKVRHLCRAHGLKLWRDAVVPAAESLANGSRTSSVKSTLAVPLTTSRDDRKYRRDHRHR